MKLTVLLDLDDTLLSNNMETFVPHYLKKLSQHINTVSPENLGRHIMTGTQMMIDKQSPAQTLEQVFEEYFYPAIGTSKESIRGKVDHFYENVFPTLQRYTQPRPEAVRMVQGLFEMGHRVAIATNPVFPRAATYHRLRWANLAPEDNPFGLISTYENFHYTKPNPAYYAEILGHLGWPEGPAVMIGNDWEGDIRTASRFGLPVFWVTETPGALPEEAHSASSQGKLADVIPWLETITTDTFELDCSQPETLLAILRSTPAALETIVLAQPEHQWPHSPSEDEWSLNEIICHLRDVDQDVNLVRFRQIITEENPFIASIDSDSWNSERCYNKQDGYSALNEWFQSRTLLINVIENMPPSVWEKTVRHTIFGPTTAAEMVSFIATHDQNHIRQACSVIQTLNLAK